MSPGSVDTCVNNCLPLSVHFLQRRQITYEPTDVIFSVYWGCGGVKHRNTWEMTRQGQGGEACLLLYNSYV